MKNLLLIVVAGCFLSNAFAFAEDRRYSPPPSYGPSRGGSGPGMPTFWREERYRPFVQPMNFSIDRVLNVGEKIDIDLRGRYFVGEVAIEAESLDTVGASFHVFVNGQQRGPWNVPGVDPTYTVPISAETSTVTIVSAGIQGTRQGRLRIRGMRCDVLPTDYERRVSDRWPTPPGMMDGEDLGFPMYYRTVLGNLSNRVIILIDRLQGFANYRAYGTYLLPIKIAAAEARTAAEVDGDAHSYAREFFEELLDKMNAAQPYLRDTYERSYAFDCATELLTLRERIRRAIGPRLVPRDR